MKVRELIVDNGTDSVENMIYCLDSDKGTDREWIAVGFSDRDGYAESLLYCHPSVAQFIADACNYYIKKTSKNKIPTVFKRR